MALKPKTCAHLKALGPIKTGEEKVCEACVSSGGTWVHLRTCQDCGQTLCCDSSPNQHARRHFETHAHPVFASAEPGERWLYCFEDELFQTY